MLDASSASAQSTAAPIWACNITNAPREWASYLKAQILWLQLRQRASRRLQISFFFNHTIQ